MASLKEQLDQAGFDTSSLDERAILSQLDDAGFDTSQFSGTSNNVMTPQASLEMQKYLPVSPVPAPGTVPPGMYEAAQGRDPSMFKAAEESSTALAEDLGKAGVNPYISAAISLPFAMGPDIALGAIPGGEATAPAARAASTAVRKGKSAAKGLADVLLGPGKERAAAEATASLSKLKGQVGELGMKAAEAPEKFARLEQLIPKLVARSGKQIGSAEKGAGMFIKQLPKGALQTLDNPKALKDFSKSVIQMGERTPDEILAMIPTEQLNVMRKMGEELAFRGGDDFTKLGGVRFREGLQKIAKALDQSSPEFKAARASFGKQTSRLKNLPKEKRLEMSAIRKQQQALQQELSGARVAGAESVAKAAKRDETRKKILYGLLSTGALGGVGAFFR